MGADGRRRVRLVQAIDPNYNDSITSSEPDGRAYDDALPELPLPGSGERDGDCGVDFPLVCEEVGCGHIEHVGRTCRRSRCPRCYKSWAFQRASVWASKLEGLRRYRQSCGTDAKLHHVTVSFANIDARFNSEDALARGFAAVKRLMDEVGVNTGVTVYHPFRIAEEYRGDVLGHESGDGDMTWKDVLAKVESDAWSWDAVRSEFLSYAPHFHVFCETEWFQHGAVTDRIADETGVVVHRIENESPDRGKYSIWDLEGLCRAMMYSLTHVGIATDADGETQRAAVRAFGEVSAFEPTASVEAETKATLREVAPKVLGCHFPTPRCDNPRVSDDVDDDAADRPAVRALSSPSSDDTAPALTSADAPTSLSDGGSETWSETRGVVPDFIYEAPRELCEPCGGTLVPISAAGGYLDFTEWRDALDPADRVAIEEAYAEWCGDGEPEPPPDPALPPD